MRNLTWTTAAALATSLALAPVAAHAQQQVFNAIGTSGAPDNEPLSARAAFTFGAGNLQVTLTNTLAPNQIISRGQAISWIEFVLTNPVGTVGAATASGQLGDVQDNGSVTYVGGAPTRWVSPAGYEASGTNVRSTTLLQGTPSQLILPFVVNGGSFINSNNGLRTTGDPYVIGPLTLNLALSGVTANTRVTSVRIGFGTGPNTFLPGTPTQVVPEPSTYALLATGLAGIGLVARRRRARS